MRPTHAIASIRMDVRNFQARDASSILVTRSGETPANAGVANPEDFEWSAFWSASDQNRVDRWVGSYPTKLMLFAAVFVLIGLMLQAVWSGKADAAPSRWQGPVIATWYGPGFYGNTFACGGRYHRSIRGVAHRTLPCGSHVTLRWQGRYVRAKVIDRGPFSGATFDFTARTAMDLCRCSRPYTIHGVRWKRS